ncbi:MAG: TraB/GumN family protein [Oscillospiraceae bacterium]|nr:TraB/GumN family protein [Oscillospiraceae bacterium]
MKTVIGLYGSVHNPDILKEYGWTEDMLRQLFTEFDPDIICGEVRPEDYAKAEGYRGPGEYRRFIFDLCENNGITFCPCDSFDELTLSVSEDIDENAPRWKEIMDRYMASSNMGELPFNSENFNEIVREKQDYQQKHAPDAHEIIWNRRNRNIVRNITDVINSNPSKRILVVFGAEHIYRLKENLEILENTEIVFPLK